MLKSLLQVLFCHNWIGSSVQFWCSFARPIGDYLKLYTSASTSISWWLSGNEFICKAGHTEMAVQSLGWEDPRDQEMATHSSNLAWKVSRAEEPGRLQSMRSQKTWIWVSETVYVLCTLFFFFFGFITFLDPTEEKRKVFGTLKDPNTCAQSSIFKHI